MLGKCQQITILKNKGKIPVSNESTVVGDLPIATYNKKPKLNRFSI